MTSSAPLTFPAWTAALGDRGLTVLSPSHRVPVELWLRSAEHGLLHFFARGTRVVLRAHRPEDLTWLLLRSECDCAEHRTAGAGRRLVLRPGAVPVAEVVLDGAAAHDWRGYDAGLIDVPTAAAVFDRLLAALSEPVQARGAVA